MATQDNPLLSLDPEKQRKLVELAESDDIDKIAEQTGLTRRQVLGIGVGLIGSAGAGGLAVSEAINPAQAQADTGDSDGNVGLPTDRVDVFADGIDSNSLSTDQSLTVSRTSINAQTPTIADDDVVVINSNMYRVEIYGPAPVNNGVWGADFGDLYEVYISQDTTTQSGTLSGTTGPDGSLNVGRDGGDLYVENRTGSSDTFDIHLFEG